MKNWWLFGRIRKNGGMCCLCVDMGRRESHGGRGRAGGVLVNMHAVVSRPLALYPYNTGKEHARFSRARLRFPRVILNVNHYSYVAILTRFCHWGLSIPGNQVLHIRQA